MVIMPERQRKMWLSILGVLLVLILSALVLFVSDWTEPSRQQIRAADEWTQQQTTLELNMASHSIGNPDDLGVVAWEGGDVAGNGRVWAPLMTFVNQIYSAPAGDSS